MLYKDRGSVRRIRACAWRAGRGEEAHRRRSYGRAACSVGRAVNAIAAELEYPTNAAAGTPLMFPDMDSYERVIASARKNAEGEAGGGARRCARRRGLPREDERLHLGKVAEGIVEYAEDNDIEIIVMGRRGLGALRGMLGSVSYAVLHQADIPVLTVK